MLEGSAEGSKDRKDIDSAGRVKKAAAVEGGKGKKTGLWSKSLQMPAAAANLPVEVGLASCLLEVPRPQLAVLPCSPYV
jgi:hypothetical protein